ncbi:MAG TPA: malonyl-CoA synthase [Dongiaceae bacterium]|nr:malonyl-CoA synthase [Dongiaceae bacterium]
MPAHLFHGLLGTPPDPAKIFLETPDGRILTYGELLAGTARFAHFLVKWGLKPGDRLAVQVEKSPEAIILYLAAARAGMVFLPLNTAYTTAELDYFIEDAAPALVVVDPARRDALEAIACRYGAALDTLDAHGGGSIIEGARELPAEFADVERGPDDLAALLYTSGTTGRSKGAMLTQDNLLSNALVLREYWHFSAADILLHALPIFHTHGLFVATNVVLAASASMLSLPKFDADQVMRMLPRATSLMGVPTFYVRLLQHPALSRETTGHIRLFVSGSAPLLAETYRAWSARTGHAILERYGMTETNMNTSNPYDGERIPGTVGFPLPGVALRISEPEGGRELPRGETGMIEVRGPNVFKGYWRNPEKTRAEFRPDGFFITGDLGKIDERGYVHILGRGKDLIISGGYNVYPKEVESEIDRLPGVMESAVIGVTHPDLGEGVTAVVVRTGEETIDEATIQRRLKERLAGYKQPKRVVFVADLPRNTMGKVRKNLLRESCKDLYQK